jgi:hypothetical protein
MSSATIADKTVEQKRDEQTQPLSRTLDWAISLFLVLAGGVFAAGGVLLAGFADIGRITSWVATGRITSTSMSDAELIDAVFAFIWGSGISLTMTGVMLVVAGIAFFGVQTRARRRFEATGIASPSTTGNAMLGAMITIVASFVPFSPVIGGAVSGYLNRGSDSSAVRTGGLAGLFAAIPVVTVFAVIVWSLLGSATGLTAIIVASLVVSLIISVAYMIGLSVLGAYLGTHESFINTFSNTE